MQGSRLDMFLPLCKAAKLACSYHFARQRNCHVLTTLQGSKLGMVREGQQLMGVSSQEVQLQDGGGGCSGQHIPHRVVLWDGLRLACQPDVPPVAHLWGLHSRPHSSPGVPLNIRNATDQGYYPSQGVLPITRGRLIAWVTSHHKGQNHHKGFCSSHGADSSQIATAHPKVQPLISKSTGHKMPIPYRLVVITRE